VINVIFHIPKLTPEVYTVHPPMFIHTINAQN